MKVKYNYERLGEIVGDIQALIGVSISVVDLDKNMVFEGKNDDEFCERICAIPEGRSRCECSDSDLIARCAAEGRAVSHICHAGILDTVVPIVKDGTVAGYIFLGRIRPYPEPKNIPERITWLGDSAEEIEERYSKLTYLAPKRLSALVRLISNAIFDGAVEIEYDSFIEGATSYIAKNLDTPLDVTTLCERLYVSKNRLYDEFKEAYGKTVNDYIWDERIKRGKELLQTSDMSLGELSAAVGIDNPAYFSKIFKERVGISPSAFRKIAAKSAATQKP